MTDVVKVIRILDKNTIHEPCPINLELGYIQRDEMAGDSF